MFLLAIHSNKHNRYVSHGFLISILFSIRHMSINFSEPSFLIMCRSNFSCLSDFKYGRLSSSLLFKTSSLFICSAHRILASVCRTSLPPRVSSTVTTLFSTHCHAGKYIRHSKFSTILFLKKISCLYTLFCF